MLVNNIFNKGGFLNLIFLVFLGLMTMKPVHAAVLCFQSYAPKIASGRDFIMMPQEGYGPGFPFLSRQEHQVLAKEAWTNFFNFRPESRSKDFDLHIRIFLNYFRDGQGTKEIAQEFNLSQSRVNSILKKIVSMVQRNRQLMDFLRFENPEAGSIERAEILVAKMPDFITKLSWREIEAEIIRLEAHLDPLTGDRLAIAKDVQDLAGAIHRYGWRGEAEFTFKNPIFTKSSSVQVLKQFYVRLQKEGDEGVKENSLRAKEQRDLKKEEADVLPLERISDVEAGETVKKVQLEPAKVRKALPLPLYLFIR